MANKIQSQKMKTYASFCIQYLVCAAFCISVTWPGCGASRVPTSYYQRKKRNQVIEDHFILSFSIWCLCASPFYSDRRQYDPYKEIPLKGTVGT